MCDCVRMDGFITTAEMALREGVSPQAIGQRVRRGELEPVVKLPGLRGAYLFLDPYYEDDDDER